MPDGSMGDHSEVSMLINQNYCHGPEQEKHKLTKTTKKNFSVEKGNNNCVTDPLVKESKQPMCLTPTPSLYIILTQFYSIYILMYYLPEIHFHIILQPSNQHRHCVS
jgi:hypothetical protein